MARLVATLVALAVLPATVSAADDRSEARKIVDKGIEFLGGEKNLKKYKAAKISEKGTFYGMGDGLPYTGEYAISRPDKFRMVIKDIFTQIINGDKGWVKMGDSVTAMSKAQIKNHQNGLYVDRVSQLYPLRNNKEFKLSIAGKGKVGGKAVTVVKVTSKGREDVKLSFDNANGALLQVEYKAGAEGMPDKLVTDVITYSDYKTIKGIKYASKYKLTRDGKKYVEATFTSFEPLEKVDSSLFEKPK